MYAVVRVRGTVHIIPSIKKTLSLLSLNRCNHCVLVGESVEMRGMLRKAKDYITWGEVDSATLSKLLEHRARLAGEERLSPDIVKSVGFKSYGDFAEAILARNEVFPDIGTKIGIKRVIRLHPPVKGYEGIKRSYRAGGALGYRGKDINILLSRMLLIDETGGPKPKQRRGKEVD